MEGKPVFFRAKNLSVNTWRSWPDICSLIFASDPKMSWKLLGIIKKNLPRHMKLFSKKFTESVQALNIQEGDVFFALATFVSETGEAMNLVEGEKVHVLEWNNTDW